MPTLETLDAAQTALGHEFANQDLLREALTHASIAETRAASNERLEFLGDAVLGLVVCEFLYQNYPDLLEGDMTKIKSVAVSRRTCARIADKMGLVEMLKLGKGMTTGGELPSSLAAAALESVVGALYIDAGLEAVQAFLLPHLEPVIHRAATSGHQQNFKSVLQHVAQQDSESMPAYILLDEKGPDHSKCFEVCVEIGARTYPSSWGQSKKQAEQQAALNALLELGYATREEDGEIVVNLPSAEELEDEADIDADEEAAGVA